MRGPAHISDGSSHVNELNKITPHKRAQTPIFQFRQLAQSIIVCTKALRQKAAPVEALEMEPGKRVQLEGRAEPNCSGSSWSGETLRSELRESRRVLFSDYRGWFLGREWSIESAESKMEAGRLVRLPLNANEQVEMVT